jgi:hypothetical protein
LDIKYAIVNAGKKTKLSDKDFEILFASDIFSQLSFAVTIKESFFSIKLKLQLDENLACGSLYGKSDELIIIKMVEIAMQHIITLLSFSEKTMKSLA